MEQIDRQALNKKLAEWAGFKPHYIYPGSISWTFPPDENFPDGDTHNWSPTFTESLDACFKWLVPKAQMMGHRVVLEASPDGGFVAHIIRKESVDTVGVHFAPALALCLAIEKLIDSLNISSKGVQTHD